MVVTEKAALLCRLYLWAFRTDVISVSLFPLLKAFPEPQVTSHRLSLHNLKRYIWKTSPFMQSTPLRCGW